MKRLADYLAVFLFYFLILYFFLLLLVTCLGFIGFTLTWLNAGMDDVLSLEVFLRMVSPLGASGLFVLAGPPTLAGLIGAYNYWEESKTHYPYIKRRKFKDIEDESWDVDVDD